MNESVKELGNKFACLTRYTCTRGACKTYYQAESTFLTGGRHFVTTSDTPEKALELLCKAVKKFKAL